MSSTQHMPARLRFEDDFGATVIREYHQAGGYEKLVASTWGGPNEDVARRLVACWNAFENVTTEAIEAYPHEIDARIQQLIRDRQALVDALAKTEAYLLERLAGNPGSTGATVILPMIRKALEGAGVTPTPTSWGDFPGSEATHG